MSNSSERYLQLLREAQTISPDMLPDDFPYSEFQRNLTRYNEADAWYNGSKLEETLVIAGKEVKKYPVKINPIKGTCGRHNAMLFGDIQDDDQMLVTPRVVKGKNFTEAQVKLAESLEDVLMQVWYENNGRDLQLNNGFMSQRYGGCVFYIKYDPASPFSYPVAIEAPNPKFFIGVPNSSNPYILEEGWIVKPISKIEIDNQGIIPVSTGLFGIRHSFSDDVHWLVEHWTRRTYEVFVDNRRVGRNVVLPGSGNTEVVEIGGLNALGLVPIVYIPHIRNSSNFYGDNAFDNVVGIVREINARVADYGDAVSMDSHDIVATRNINGSIEVKPLLPGVTRVDLGSGVNVTGQEAQPEAKSLRTGASASTQMKELVHDVLYKQYRRDAIHPAVCDGEDEGSQRSSQTLTTRMWSLETHAMQERVEWTSGLNILAKIIVRIIRSNAPEFKLSEEQEHLRIRQVWYPTLKRDRNDIVTELSTRIGAHLLSITKGIEKLGDTEDVEAERERILQDIKDIGEITAKQNQSFENKAVNESKKSNQSKKTTKGE
jgi:hypothetical protein